MSARQPRPDPSPDFAVSAAADGQRRRPLAGRRILVTRAAGQASIFTRLLREAGAEVVEAPTIAIEPPPSWAPLDSAIGRIGDFGWVVFTSVNGVAMFGGRLAHHGLSWSALGRARLAAIGPATALALGEHGIAAEVVPDEYRAEGLVERLRELLRPDAAVLLPRAAEARDVLVRELRALGVEVVEVPVYQTRPVAESAETVRRAVAAGVDVVTFTSSSTVRNFALLFSEAERVRLLEDVVVASIGPITAATAESFGLTTRIMPVEYTIPALAGAIAEYFPNDRTPGDEARPDPG